MPDTEQKDEDQAVAQIPPTSFRVVLPEYPARPLRRPEPNLGIFTSTVQSKPDALRPYHLINPADPLQNSLRGKGFLEFPTFVLVPASNETANDAVILIEDIPEDGIILRDRKRRRIDETGSSALTAPSPPAKRIGSMLGGYSSDDDMQKAKSDNPLGLLGGYDSDGSDLPQPDENEDDEEEDRSDGSDGGAQSPSDAATSPIFTEVPLASRWLHEHGEDDEAVDWGEDGE